VLLSADRVGVMATARSVGKSKLTVWRWQERFLAEGLALSLALTGASVGGVGVAPLLLTLSQRHGLGTAVPEVVLSLSAVIVPLIWIGIRRQANRRPPSTVGPRPPMITSRNELLQVPQPVPRQAGNRLEP
jgi:hypothetical protein